MAIFRLRQLSIFYQEVSTMVRGGMDILAVMGVIATESGDSKLKKIADQIKRSLIEGIPLCEAMRGIPDFFPEWQIDVIKYSEKGGKLAEGLERITGYLERDYDIQKQFIIGLAYPVVLLHIAIFILPLAELIKGSIGEYLFQVGKVILPVYAFVCFLWFLQSLSTYGAIKGIYDRVVLKVPVIGGLIKRLVIARFFRALQCLVQSGVSIIESWRIASEVAGNEVVSRSLRKGLFEIQQGSDMKDAFIATQIFPKKTIGMISAGTRSGNLDKILVKMAEYHENESQLIMGILVKIIPIVIYLFVAFYIGYRIVSFYSGYFSKILSF